MWDVIDDQEAVDIVTKHGDAQVLQSVPVLCEGYGRGCAGFLSIYCAGIMCVSRFDAVCVRVCYDSRWRKRS